MKVGPHGVGSAREMVGEGVREAGAVTMSGCLSSVIMGISDLVLEGTLSSVRVSCFFLDLPLDQVHKEMGDGLAPFPDQIIVVSEWEVRSSEV
jgi:hypothetical protein